MKELRQTSKSIAKAPQEITALKEMAEHEQSKYKDIKGLDPHIIETIDKLATHYLKQADELERQRENIVAYINQLGDERYRNILTLRFIEGYTVEETAEIICYELSYCYRLTNQAIKSLKKLINTQNERKEKNEL